MTTAASKLRGLLWPLLLVLLGAFNLACHFLGYSLGQDFLLKGVGFLLAVPLAYLYSHSFFSKTHPAYVAPALWAKWLSGAGVGLVVAGYALQWL